ncbi:MAG: hypothetical protein FWC41_03620 [Firmicutes bacterium]|nr:hypothetical protein [Bacillota bacterium]
MISKIAITGLPKCSKTLLVNALSNMTGIPCIQNKTMYDWYKIYDLFDSNDFVWKDMFLIAASSFFERAKVESYFDQFISDGASFSELMYLKINYAKLFQNKRQNERNKISESLEYVSFSYAAQQYDFIIHADSSNDGGLANNFYVELYLKYNIPYKIYNTEFLDQTLKEILHDLNIPMKQSIESSIYQTKTNLFL